MVMISMSVGSCCLSSVTFSLALSATAMMSPPSFLYTWREIDSVGGRPLIDILEVTGRSSWILEIVAMSESNIGALLIVVRGRFWRVLMSVNLLSMRTE